MSVDPPAVEPATIDQLIERCLQGDQLAWEAIVRQYWRKVFNVAYKFVGKHDEAEDLTQDIFLKIFKSLDTFDRGADANELMPVSHDPGPVAALEQRDRVVLLRQAMSALPDTLRTAVLMRDIQELSYQEIADALRLPEGTVKSRINRGRTELARQIRKLRGDEFSPTGNLAKRTGAY